MKFGVFLPTMLLPDGSEGRGAQLRAFADRAEELGFDSLWATDHVVTARRLYRVGWLDCLMVLSHVAAVTQRVRLGTSILILPLRQPAVLTKELATLHEISGDRYVFGVGAGWFGPEFEACGVRKEDRGARTDEVLEATLALMSGPGVSYRGRFYDLEDVTVEPHPSRVPPVWVAGGSQLAHTASPEPPAMHPNVLRRIVGADGWIARPTSAPSQIAHDLDLVRQARREARIASPFTVAHENFVWIDESASEEAVQDEQRRRFGAVLSDERPWEYIDAVYLPGTIGRIQQKIQERADVGVEYLMLHTLTASIDQLELIARHVIEPFRDA